MNSVDSLAHVGATGDQTLSAHLTSVSRMTAEKARKLGLERAGALIGLLHDLGKSSAEFQAYLRNPSPSLRGKIDHSTAGARCLLENIPGAMEQGSLPGLVARFLALTIASHHSGLIDCLAPDGTDKLEERLARGDDRTRYTEAWSTVDPDVREHAVRLMRDPALLAECNVAISGIRNRSSGDVMVQLGLLVRLLFSCLIDADRTDTADFERPHSASLRQSGAYSNWATLLARLDQGLASFVADTEMNQLRAAISAECFAAAGRPRGVYTLTVPTGGGKTLAALRFAMEHARQHSLERVIFVSPYISIVDQNAAVARTYLEQPGTLYASVVLEHHSNLARESADEGPDTWRRKILAENWDAPVVFTTMVQVLEAFFGSGTRAARRMHALSRAVIVFDEVQTLPVRMVHLFNNALNFMTAHCGSTVLLCTATQPLLEKVDAVKGAAKLATEHALVKNIETIFAKLKRYEVFDRTAERQGHWTREETAALACGEAAEHGSCLVIVNTKADAREIFQLCLDRMHAEAPTARVVHLSTGMCPAHRKEVLEELRRNLRSASLERPLVCVSTQLVEAGVDIDFAVVVRDLAGLDSLAQAAGRCNRHGSRPCLGRVHLVELEISDGALKHLPDIKHGREHARAVLGEWRRAHPGQPFPLDSHERMQRYFDIAFYRRKDEMSYNLGPEQAGRATTMLELLGGNRPAVEEAGRIRGGLRRSVLCQSFTTANSSFALMEPTQGVVVPFREKGSCIVSDLNCASFDPQAEWQLLREAQPYTLSVYSSQLTELDRRGAVYSAAGPAGVYCLKPEFYDSTFGLRAEAGPLEQLIV